MTPDPAPSWECLTATLPAEQREQLAELLLDRIAHGWGEVVIVVADHGIKLFRFAETAQVRKPAQ